jgi:hypothetical protein
LLPEIGDSHLIKGGEFFQLFRKRRHIRKIIKIQNSEMGFMVR